MTKYIKGKDGKFAGSIGTGRSNTPTPVPETPALPSTSGVSTDAGDVDTTLSISLRTYFATRFYPAVPDSMVEPSVEAIRNCALGEHDTKVSLPEGVLFRGETTAPSFEIVQGHRLDDHVETYRILSGIENLDEGSCDECGQTYELGRQDDHCPECGTCWEHCTYGTSHHYDH